MYIHLLWIQKLCFCGCVRDSGDGCVHLLPTCWAKDLPQAMFGHPPMWLSRRDLLLPRVRQAKYPLASVFSWPDMNPTLLAQQGQRTCKRRAIHGKAGTQRFLVGLADDGECG